MVFGDGKAVIGIDVGVEIVGLVRIFIHRIVGVIEYESHIIGIISISGEPVFVGHHIVDTVVELGVDDQSLDGSKAQGELVSHHIRLLLIPSTILQVSGVRAGHNEVSVGVVHRDDRPVATHVVIIEAVKHHRRIVVVAAETHVVDELGPLGELHVYL